MSNSLKLEINNNDEKNNCGLTVKTQSQPLNLKICQFENNNENNNTLNLSPYQVLSKDKDVAVETITRQQQQVTNIINDNNPTTPTIENNINGSSLNKWIVRNAETWHLDFEEDYKMRSNQRGICLIINNVDFELDVLPKRKGSDMDAYRFKKIFCQLGFNVESKRNLTSDKMKVTFKQISARCLTKHEALIVILLSHGTESGVYGIDGLEVDLNDILANFDNKRCRQMIGKPKVFIIQACRGRFADYGVKETQTLTSQFETQGSTQASIFNNLSQSPKITRWTEFDKNNHPTRTDMLLCFSCQTGFVSTRNEDEGSWLGASIAKYLQNEAWRKNFIEILNMVSRDVRKRKSSDGHKQVLELTLIGFDKNLYFNPGLYLDK